MDWSYGVASKGSNKKVTDEEYDDCDEKGKPTEDGYGYPYEGGVKPAAVVVDGGQRKSSITHYPNVDGSDSYVVRTERVVKVVRPVMTTHYSLKEDHDNLGMAKNFIDQFLKEAAMSGAPVQSHTYWGCKPVWAGRDDDFPLKYDEYSQFSPPNMGTVAKFPGWEDTEHQELGNPTTGSRRNSSSLDESPSRFLTHPRWNHPNHSGGRHNWPSQDDSPPRSMMHPELNHINSSSARPNWPSRDNSFPRPLVRHQLSQSNPGSTPNWARQYDSPPRSVEYLEVGHSNSSAKPNWPSRYNSPPPSTRRFVSNHPNSSARSNWQTRDDSPSRFMTHLESSYYPNSSTRPNWPSQYDSPSKSMYLKSSHPNLGVRLNWSSKNDFPPRPREYSPPRSMTHLTLNHPNSPSTKPSWASQEDSPDNIENGRDKINTGLVLKKFDELNLQDSRGTSPLPNERSGSDVSKTANYNGTSMDSGQRPNWPNRKGHVHHGTNSGISPYKTNKDDHEKPKFNGAQSNNDTHDEEIPDTNNKKIATLHKEDSYKIPYSDWPVEDEDVDDDSKKSGILRSSTNVRHKASKTKPNYSSGSYKQPIPPPVSSTTNDDEVSEMMKLVEEAKKTATYDPNEITPNPPQQMHYSTYAVPAAPWGYYKPVLDSNEASRKYNGIAAPNAYQSKPKFFISN